MIPLLIFILASSSQVLSASYEGVSQNGIYRELYNEASIADISFDEYNRYETTTSLLNIGKSSEGRDILGVKISSGKGPKPAILVDGGIHAREWLSPATALYLVHQLATNESNRNMFDEVDWYILPLINPDGYEYTHTNDRMWRKTRSKGQRCDGVDPNRNFGYHWLENGANLDECSGIYAGPFPYSEPEVASLCKFALSHKHFIKLYITLHSYGSYIMYPWGYKKNTFPEDVDDLHFLAQLAKRAIMSVRGTNYTVGTSANLLGAAAGGSDDWMKGIAKIKYSYTIELPAGGYTGFDAPPSEIWDTAKETFEAFRAFAYYIKIKYVFKS